MQCDRPKHSLLRTAGREDCPRQIVGPQVTGLRILGLPIAERFFPRPHGPDVLGCVPRNNRAPLGSMKPPGRSPGQGHIAGAGTKGPRRTNVGAIRGKGKPTRPGARPAGRNPESPVCSQTLEIKSPDKKASTTALGAPAGKAPAPSGGNTVTTVEIPLKWPDHREFENRAAQTPRAAN